MSTAGHWRTVRLVGFDGLPGKDRHAWVDPRQVAAVHAAGHDVIITLHSGALILALSLPFAEGPADATHVDAVVERLTTSGDRP